MTGNGRVHAKRQPNSSNRRITLRMGLCDSVPMDASENRVVSASREVQAGPDGIFELIADPSRQPDWDGNDNLSEAAPGQRVHAVGDVFSTTLTLGAVRENHVVEFE